MQWVGYVLIGETSTQPKPRGGVRNLKASNMVAPLEDSAENFSADTAIPVGDPGSKESLYITSTLCESCKRMNPVIAHLCTACVCAYLDLKVTIMSYIFVVVIGML